MTPIIRGNSLYASVLGPKWLEAEANAVALGGNLASIGNASENEFIRTSFNSDPLLYVPAANEYVAWFGLTFNSSSEWVNTNGEKQSYFNWNPTFLDPDTTVYGQRNTTILLQSPSPYVYVQGSWDDSYENQPVPYYRNGIAEIPLTLSITQSAQPKEGVGLFTTSINLSAGTQTSGNLAEGAQVWWEVTGITQNDLGAGSAGLTGTGTISSGKLDIQHSLVSDADAGEQFSVSVYSDPAMTQQIRTTFSTGIQETTTSYGKTGLLGNSLYTLVQGSLWSDALSRSIAIGGTLAAIASASENQFVVNTFSDMPVSQAYGRDYRLVWIGLTDEQAEGTWKWTTNEQITYTNWYAGSPSGDGDYADLAIANTTDAASRIAGDWNDAPNGGELYPYVSYGVAEVPLQLSITRSGTPKEGGGLFTTSINLSAGTQTSGNLAEGASVYWKIEGITQDDLALGALTGTGTISTGKLEIQHSLVPDADTGEQFSVSVYSDSAMTQQIGATSSATVQESDNTPPTITDISVRGSSVVLTLSEKVQATGINNSTFVVKVGGTARSVTANSLDPTDQSKVTLTLSGTAPSSSASLQVSYAGTNPNIVKDIAGNSLETFTNRSADTFLSGASVTSLYADYTNLTLTGASAINGTGNAKNNTIIGNSANNALNGAAGADVITGQGGTDTFVYTTLANSLLGTPTNYTFDRITDFAVGQDRIDGPKTASTSQVQELGTVTTLDQAGLQGVLTSTKFVANGAASFTYNDNGSTRTFVALNNNVAGFDVTKDAVVEITGYSGLLTNLAIV